MDIEAGRLKHDFSEFLKQTGMADVGVRPDMIRDLGDDTYLVIKPLLFHWTMLRGHVGDLFGYFDRWCYTDEAGARAAFEAFPYRPPAGYEPQGWHRHPKTLRRRPDGDPAREYREA